MKINFHKNKYDKELSIDCLKIAKNPKLILDNRPFYVTFYEIVFITKGSGTFKLDNEIMPFEPGTVLLLPPNGWRQWQDCKTKVDGYFLVFEEEFIAQFFNDALYLYRFHFFNNTHTPSFVQFDLPTFQQIIIKLEEIQQEINSLKSDSEHLLRSLLYYLLILINRKYEATFALKGSYFQDALTLRFRKLLETHIRTHHQVNDYAQMLQVSRSHLNKVLKSHFGKNCSVLIKERLLIEIKKELSFSTKTIAEISFELHFSEPANFIRFFQTATGLSPKAFRQQNTK
ncbi:hypothetical protein BKI52_38365 [marine bacterium AO1-C]|nr:hypothetical protein BKI52_38365 [marine bacterium AO1-C]